MTQHKLASDFYQQPQNAAPRPTTPSRQTYKLFIQNLPAPTEQTSDWYFSQIDEISPSIAPLIFESHVMIIDEPSDKHCNAALLLLIAYAKMESTFYSSELAKVDTQEDFDKAWEKFFKENMSKNHDLDIYPIDTTLKELWDHFEPMILDKIDTLDNRLIKPLFQLPFVKGLILDVVAQTSNAYKDMISKDKKDPIYAKYQQKHQQIYAKSLQIQTLLSNMAVPDDPDPNPDYYKFLADNQIAYKQLFNLPDKLSSNWPFMIDLIRNLPRLKAKAVIRRNGLDCNPSFLKSLQDAHTDEEILTWASDDLRKDSVFAIEMIKKNRENYSAVNLLDASQKLIELYQKYEAEDDAWYEEQERLERD